MTTARPHRAATSLVLLSAIALFLVTVEAAAQDQRPALPGELDAYVQATLREWDIPGAAIAVVRDGRPVALAAYGVRAIGRPEPVDVDTIFDAASLAKSFTAAAIATLVDEKRLSWDVPVKKLLPTLEFPDPYLTANVTIRDLLCHRTGVAATNSAWLHSNLTRTELIGLVKHMKMDAPFRTRMVYSNVGYTIAGEAAAAAAETSWEELVTQRLIVPLGLTRTTADWDAAPAMGNCASGHAMLGSAGVYEDPSVRGYEHRAIPRESTTISVAPAGSIHSSARDLARWMIFQLGDGTHEGKRIVSAESMDQMHFPHMIIQAPPAMRAARQVRFFGGYGMGWQVMDYRGHPLYWHSGAGDGQRVYMTLLPEEKLGVVVLLNSQKVEGLHGALITRIIDHYLDVPTRDYVAELREPWEKDLRAWEEQARQRQASRKTDTKPSVAPGAYAGTYRDQLGLDIVVTEEDGALFMRRAGGDRAKLEHWQDDEFVTRWHNPLHAQTRSTLVSFEIDKHAGVGRLRMTLGRDAVDAVREAPATQESPDR
jgi:CubicO group peptidase (beta-lactamase class C family)